MSPDVNDKELNNKLQSEVQSTSNNEAVRAEKIKKYVGIGAGVISIVAVLAIGLEIYVKSINQKDESQTSATKTEQQTTIAIPAEAKDFVNNYGNKFADPVSTYFAEMAYEKDNGGLGSFISDELANSDHIPTNTVLDGISELGFTTYELPTKKNMNQETSIEIFNTYTAKNLDRYMNLLARNPSLETRDLINKQMQNYCSKSLGDNLPAIAFSIDDPKITSLMELAQKVVSKYGSNANYKVAPAKPITSDPYNKDTTLFTNIVSNPETYDWHDQKIEAIHEVGVRLVIDVDIYNGKEVTHKKEIIKDVELFIIRQPETFGGIAGAPEYNIISIGAQ